LAHFLSSNIALPRLSDEVIINALVASNFLFFSLYFPEPGISVKFCSIGVVENADTMREGWLLGVFR
jgi:hypothetical protein